MLMGQPLASADAPGCCCRAAELAMQSLNGRLLYGQEVSQSADSVIDHAEGHLVAACQRFEISRAPLATLSLP